MNTWTDIRAAFRDITRDVDANVFSAATVERWANLALDDLCEAALYVDSVDLRNAVASVGQYATAAGGYDVFRVEYDGERLFPITRDQLRYADRDWESRTGTPRYYYLDEMMSTPAYLYTGIFERPSTTVTNGLRIWYHSYPTDVDDDSASTEIEVPDWAVAGVLFYMLREAYTADTDMKDLGAADMYGVMYEDVKERLVRRSRDRQPVSRVAGQPSSPSINVINRLPERITES